MMKFFIDGSAKGLVVGAGVVEVDEFGFMTTYEDHKLHPLAESGLSELFALNLAMEKVLSSNAAQISIFVDTFRIENLFRHEEVAGKIVFGGFDPCDHDMYIRSIREKVKTFYESKGPSAKLSITKLLDTNFEYNVFTNTAHKLSRCYFNHYKAIYLDENTPLRRNDETTKSEINKITKLPETVIPTPNEVYKIDTRIDFNDGYWLVHLLDSELRTELQTNSSDDYYLSSKHLVNAILYTCQRFEKALKSQEITVYVSSNADIVSKIEGSISYVNCPQDIKDKGHKILSMIENGELVIE